MGPSGSPHRLGFYTSLGEDGRRQGSRSRGVLHVVWLHEWAADGLGNDRNCPVVHCGWLCWSGLSHADSATDRLCRLSSSSASEITICSQLAEKRGSDLPPSLSACSHRGSSPWLYLCRSLSQRRRLYRQNFPQRQQQEESWKPVRRKLKLEKAEVASPSSSSITSYLWAESFLFWSFH